MGGKKSGKKSGIREVFLPIKRLQNSNLGREVRFYPQPGLMARFCCVILFLMLIFSPHFHLWNKKKGKKRGKMRKMGEEKGGKEEKGRKKG